MLKKILSLVMAMMMVVSVAACGREGEDNVEIDANKTQLYVANYDSGFGSVWLDKVMERFEEDYKDYEFEPGTGKKGVQFVLPKKDKTTYGKALLNDIGDSTYDVFFTEGVYYYNFVSENKLLDITDIVTEPLTAYGETESIEDKLGEDHKSFYKVNGEKYYALPHFEATTGIIYDIDLFETNEYFFAADKNNGNGGFTNKASGEELSLGPDGKPNTDDDGLPATYDEFFALCDKMKSEGVTPICWNGLAVEYLTDFAKSLAADYDGKAETMLNFTFGGTANSIVTGFDSDGNPILSSREINPSNAYLLAQQAGKYYGLSFVERLISGKYFATGSFSGANSHTDNQGKYMRSKLDSTMQTIAMLIDGTWWENEATNAQTYDSLTREFGTRAKKENRHFGFMPLPKATSDQVGDPWTVYELFQSASFINANVPQNRIKAAKMFLQYCHTQKSLVEFSVTTNTMKAFNYSLDNDKDKLSNWGKSMYSLHSNAQWVTPYAQNEMYLHSAEIKWESQIGDTPYNNPARDFYDYSIKAKDWFEGMKTVNSASYWQSFKNYFGE